MIKKYSQKVKRWYKDLQKHFKIFRAPTTWIIFLLGIAFTLIGFFKIINPESVPSIITYNQFQEISKWVGNALLVGCIVGYLSSYAQFRKVYREDLSEILYDTDFLEKRKDIEDIWFNVSQTLFEKKFPKISNKLLYIIKDKYFPLKDVSYYNDYQTLLVLEWEDKPKDLVKVTQDIRFTLIAHDKSKFKFPLGCKMKISGLNQEEYSFCVDPYLVNGLKVEPILDNTNSKTDDNYYEVHYYIELEGELEYRISKTITKVYNIRQDFHTAFKAKYMLNKLRVQLFNKISDDVNIEFIPRGVIDEYETIKNTKEYLEYQYNGLILPKQGYVFVFDFKN